MNLQNGREGKRERRQINKQETHQAGGQNKWTVCGEGWVGEVVNVTPASPVAIETYVLFKQDKLTCMCLIVGRVTLRS